MENHRRKAFSTYFDTELKGSREALMTRTGLTKGRVSQLFDEDQPFGEIAARNLAHRLGLPGDYFEREHGSGEQPAQGLSDAAIKLAQQYDQLSDSERQRFRLLILAARDGVEPDIGLAPGRPPRKRIHDEFLGGDSGFSDLDVTREKHRKGGHK